jgi:hypothetical protein
VGEGEKLGEREAEKEVTPLVRGESVLDKESVLGEGSGAAELVSELDHSGKIQTHGQSGEATGMDSLQSTFSGFGRPIINRNQSPSCPRCLRSEHEFRACPYRAETIYHLCCERWETHSSACGRQTVTRPFLELTTCPRCLQLGHRVRECPAEAVTQYLTSCKQWRSHNSGCVGTLESKQFSR